MKKRLLAMGLAVCMVLNFEAFTMSAVAAETAENALLLHYDFDAATGTKVEDKKGNYDGTLAGAAAWGDGIIDGAVSLPGAREDYVSIPKEVFTQSNDISIVAWMKADTVQTWTTLLTAGSGGSNYSVLAIKGNPSNNACGVTMATKVNGGTEYRVKANDGDSPEAGVWTMVTFTQSGKNAKLYMNDKLIAENNDMQSTIRQAVEASAESAVRLGSNMMFNDPSLKGAVDDLKIYNKALSATEVAALANAEELQESILKWDLEKAAESIDLGDLSDVTKDLKLETKASNGVKISWTSSNTKYITNDGKVTIPTKEEGDQTITLTAVFSLEGTEATLTKTYKVTLKAMSDEVVVKRDADYVQRYVDYIINDGYELLTSEDLDGKSDIKWELTSGAAAIENGKVVKTAASSERQAIKLKAVLTKGTAKQEVVFEHVTLLDPYVGYILSFFGGNDDEQKLHLGYSYDGLTWYQLNDGNAVLKTTQGNGNVRDPFILRKKDGSFGVVATQGWDTAQIYLWDSEDLVTYTNERLKTVTKENVAGLTGRRAWAPEISYDPLKDQYIVYWSDPNANGGSGCTYANTSKDLETFSDPFVLYDAGYKMIDANIIKWNGSYYMVFKDERGDNSGNGGKTIQMAKSDSLEAGTFEQYTGPITESPVEGPFMFKVIGEEKWYHYYDYFNEHKFGVSVSTDLASGEWQFLGKSTTMPTADVRHGGVVAVTEKEMGRILTGYAKTEQVYQADGSKVEAENGSYSGEAKSGDAAACSNGKYAGSIGGPNHGSASFVVNADEAGTYTISITHCTYESRPLSVVVNGKAYDIADCPVTGDWTAPAAAPIEVNVNLDKGANVIILTGVGTAYGPNLDYFTVKKAGVVIENPAVTAAKEALDKAKADAKSTFDGGQKNYTDESWNAFTTAYNNAVNAAADADAAALNSLVAALNDAKDKLVEKQPETPPSESETVPSESETQTPPSESETQTVPTETEQKPSESEPETPPTETEQKPSESETKPTESQKPSETNAPGPDVTPTPEETKIINGLGVSKETAQKISALAAQQNISADILLMTDASIKALKNDKDVKGSSFALFQARAAKQTKNTIKLKWNKLAGADGYAIYGNRCGKKYEYIGEVQGKTSYTQKNQKKGSYYKYIVRAYKVVDGTKVTIAASKTIHAATTGGKKGVAKSITVNAKKVKLNRNKTFKLKAKEINKTQKISKHRSLKYESTNTKVAKVSAKGKIKAVGKGTCHVYVYAQNGIYKKVTVTVK